jgi:hypothetical protein
MGNYQLDLSVHFANCNLAAMTMLQSVGEIVEKLI